MTETKIPSEREIELLRLVIRERTGREVAKTYEAETGARIPYGTVYTLFAQMEERGWVRVRQATEGDLRVRHIKISNGGLAALNAASKHYARLSRLAATTPKGNS